MFEFKIKTEDNHSKARTGIFSTPHGKIRTPVFMPVGTQASVKNMGNDDLDASRAEIVLGNTYHLYLRPGADLIKEAGGLQKFTGWNRPMLTDSGGFQVFSLRDISKVRKNGVTFQSHLDGSRHTFTPAGVIDTQMKIGADIIMAFDECTSYPVDKKTAAASMRLTHEWAEICFDEIRKKRPYHGYEQALFPIVQGSVFDDLRRESAEFMSEFDSPGIAIGGLSVGEPREDIYRITEVCTDILPKEKPRYAMGIGTPADLLEMVSRGVDMFDCVMPTRNARHATAFTSEGRKIFKKACWADKFSEPLDKECGCYCCRNYSIAYLRHLFMAG
ncbi:MAG: tRNA guanosine(34) transglycosylase Tgt, partial [Fibrobacterota bacterium]